jgi:hypothetical protein
LLIDAQNSPPLVEVKDGEGEKPGEDPKVRKPASILQQSALREKEKWNASRSNSSPDRPRGDFYLGRRLHKPAVLGTEGFGVSG